MDIICFSARDEDQIRISINNYIQSGEKLIVSRAINSQVLSKEIIDKIVLCKNQHTSLIARLQNMVNLSSSKYVFLAADDDYILTDNLAKMIEAMEEDPNSASGTSITCLAHKNLQEKSITIVPYLNSPLVRAKIDNTLNLKKDLTREYENMINENFLPLSVDFYSIYNRDKLRCIVNNLLKMDDSSILEISRTNKVLQFILAYAILLTGTLANINKPIYIRGDSVPMRTDTMYISRKVVHDDEKMSLGEELSIFLENKKAWSDVVHALNSIYKEYGHQSNYRLNVDEKKREIEIDKGLRLCFEATLFSLKTRLLNLHKQNYSIKLSKSEQSKPALEFDRDIYTFNINLVNQKWLKTTLPFNLAWPGFIYERRYIVSWQKLYDDLMSEA